MAMDSMMLLYYVISSLKIKYENTVERRIKEIMKNTNNRYIQRHWYGRYEVVDTTSDVTICYSGSSEYIDIIVQAMNLLENYDEGR
jgi:hypothetical protein